MLRKLSRSDRLWIILDHTLWSIVHAASFPHTAVRTPQDALRVPQSWMRINHSGEVAAQSLFLGAMCLARSDEAFLDFASHMRSEFTHLVMCKEALWRLKSPPSRTDPLWALGCFTLAALAGLSGDASAWAFVRETEVLVIRHLRESLRALTDQDPSSAEIIRLMIDDERAHADHAQARAPRQQSGLMPVMRPLFRLMKAAVE